jgi:hypothetical protein
LSELSVPREVTFGWEAVARDPVMEVLAVIVVHVTLPVEFTEDDVKGPVETAPEKVAVGDVKVPVDARLPAVTLPVNDVDPGAALTF